MKDLYEFMMYLLIAILVGIHVIDSVKGEIDDLYNRMHDIEKTLDEIKKSLWIEPDDD